jgi:hypothetical protein
MSRGVLNLMAHPSDLRLPTPLRLLQRGNLLGAHLMIGETGLNGQPHVTIKSLSIAHHVQELRGLRHLTLDDRLRIEGQESAK